MATSASLVVRISADINDFSKKFDKATKDVEKASKKIEGFGRAMTLGITVPVAAAAVALAKMGAENEDTAGRISRVFGGMASNIESSITEMMKSVPEARTDLEKMAISIDNMLQGMDLAPSTAAAMSESLLKLAGDASAFAHVPMADALDALGKGMTGKGKGLLDFGLQFKDTEVKQRAFQMGLISSGQELTETGTALASYSLIMEKAGRITGEAGRTADQSGKQFAFLKRDVSELADNLSQFVLPLMSGLAKGARDATNDVAGLSDGTKKVALDIAGAAAVIIPAALGAWKLAQAFFTIKTGVSLLTSGTSMATFFAEATNPIGQVLIGITAVTAAVYGLVEAYRHIKGPSAADLMAPLNNDPKLAAFVKANPAQLPPGKNGPTGINPKLDFEQLKDNADITSKAFDSALEHGTSLAAIYGKIVALQQRSADLLKEYPAQFSKEHQAVSDVADQMQRLHDILDLNNSAPGADKGILNRIAARPYDAGVSGAVSAVDAANAYRRDLATRGAASQYGTPYNATAEALISSRGKVNSTTNDLALRESMVKLPDGFDAARQASVEFAEQQRQTSEDASLAWERTKLSMTTFAGLAMQAGQLLGGLAVKVGGSGFLGGLGGSVGGGLLSHFLGVGVGTTAGILTGGIGAVAGAFIGKGLDSLFSHHTNAVDSSTTALDKLAATATSVSEALSNIPKGFSVANARLLAAVATVLPPGGGTTGGGSTGGNPPGGGAYGGSNPGAGEGNFLRVGGDLHVHLPGVDNATDFVRDLGRLAVIAKGRGGSGLQLGFGT